MVSAENQLLVKTHVARDLLQNAAVFKTDKLVVWEYVSNSLQYVDAGTSPRVKVVLRSRKKQISISDNGRGMDWRGLQNFFVMHGENVDRKKGRPGRGRFGTGKSAAFGIGDVLRITTTRSGKRSRVELRRKDVDGWSSEDPIPVRTIERETRTTASNGTSIEIEGIHLRRLDQAGIIRYIERHLTKWPKGATVFVNNHECEFSEPAVAREARFPPEGPLRAKLGDVELILKVAKAPLDEDLRGVSVYSNGVMHETTLAGSEGREMAQYIFGEIDVPRLDDDTSPMRPFDLSRSLQLNPNNPLVQAIYAFIGPKIDQLRRELMADERKRRASAEARRLGKQAAEIAKVINEDFQDFRERVAKARAKAAGGSDPYHTPAGSDQDDLIYGAELPAEEVSVPGDSGSQGGSGNGDAETPEPTPQVVPGTTDSEKKGQRAGSTGNRRRPRGGFQVQFKYMGVDEFRAKYVPDERAIHINLDHPQLAAAKGSSSIDDPIFKRLAYEVSFAEYAVALASELAARDEYLDPSDSIVDIRETINRVARKGASLYAK